ncbi:MAG: hypothetical protein IPM34_10105 [Saprospiraceae bacterium]|nr:hypothetical protein [Saprospiraceae bacterium]
MNFKKVYDLEISSASFQFIGRLLSPASCQLKDNNSPDSRYLDSPFGCGPVQIMVGVNSISFYFNQNPKSGKRFAFLRHHYFNLMLC